MKIIKKTLGIIFLLQIIPALFTLFQLGLENAHNVRKGAIIGAYLAGHILNAFLVFMITFPIFIGWCFEINIIGKIKHEN